jgi:hypothetical protein
LRLDDVVTESNREALVKAHVTYQLALEQKADEQARAYANELIQSAKTQSLEAATAALNLKVLGLSAPAGPEHPALSSPLVPTVTISRPVSMDQDVVPEVKTEEGATLALFSLEKEDAIKEQPLAAENGYVVLQLKSKELLTKEAFAEDRPKIVEMLRKRKAEQALADYVNGLSRAKTRQRRHQRHHTTARPSTGGGAYVPPHGLTLRGPCAQRLEPFLGAHVVPRHE